MAAPYRVDALAMLDIREPLQRLGPIHSLPGPAMPWHALSAAVAPVFRADVHVTRAIRDLLLPQRPFHFILQIVLPSCAQHLVAVPTCHRAACATMDTLGLLQQLRRRHSIVAAVRLSHAQPIVLERTLAADALAMLAVQGL